MRLGHTGEKSLQALAKKGLLQDIRTCKLEFYEHCVIGKKTKVKFVTAIHCTKGFLTMFTRMFGDLLRRHLLEVTATFCPLLMISINVVGYVS